MSGDCEPKAPVEPIIDETFGVHRHEEFLDGLQMESLIPKWFQVPQSLLDISPQGYHEG
jgi:hypothetical protein